MSDNSSRLDLGALDVVFSNTILGINSYVSDRTELAAFLRFRWHSSVDEQRVRSRIISLSQQSIENAF